MIILDTHALLWWTLDPAEMSPKAYKLCSEVGLNRGFISSISIWEIGVKIENKKLDIGMTIESYLEKIESLNILKIVPVDENIWIEKWLGRWNLDKEQLKKDLLSLNDNASFNDLCRMIYSNYAKSNKVYNYYIIGDKNPQYSLFIDKLISLFPEAKFIYVIRDYRDNILSFKKVRFDLKFTTALAYRWVRYNKDILKMKLKYPEKFISVQYEQLLKSPKKELERICDFLNIKYNSNMLEYYKNQDDCIPDFHKNLKKPVMKKRS